MFQDVELSAMRRMILQRKVEGRTASNMVFTNNLLLSILPCNKLNNKIIF